jgi:APA family basic amino acid/polyamine antiporter
MKKLFAIKSLDAILAEGEDEHHHLKRSLTAFDLMMLGVGAIVGTGIFAVIGTAVAGSAGHLGAGPGLMVSFLLTAVACAFCALCYAEFASIVPISGSAYTYSYATMGEFIAWVIGWDLIIEYAIGNVAVAISWAAYFHQLMNGIGVHLPAWISVDYRSAVQAADLAMPGSGADPAVALAFEAWQHHPVVFGIPIIFNFLAASIVGLITWLLVIGIKESARVNNFVVVLKVVILLFFIGVGFSYVKPENWTPFFPNGFAGVWTGASLIFFAFIGFDAISTAAEECKNPGRDMPRGILGSLILCTVLYVAIAAILTGIIPWSQLGVADPLAAALTFIHLDWAAGIVSLGAVIAMTAVLLVFQLGQPRIFFSMSRDGLLPPVFSRVHPKYKTPHVTTIWTGVAVAAFSGVANINEMVELTNIGTLFAFVLVCLGVMILRVKDPGRKRSFRTPWVPFVPLMGIAMCVYLMLGLPWATWERFIIWLAVGMAIYFFYSYEHSNLRQKKV